MSGLLHTQGESIDLTLIVGPNETLRLWNTCAHSNVPAKADIETDFVETTGSGYGAKTLTGGIAVSPAAGWTLSGSNPTIAQYNIVQSFVFSAAVGPILGYTRHRASDNKLKASSKFASSFTGVQVGDTLNITIKHSLQ